MKVLGKRFWFTAAAAVLLLMLASDAEKKQAQELERQVQEQAGDRNHTEAPVDVRDGSAKARGGRTLGVGLSEGSVGGQKALAAGHELKIKTGETPMQWGELEKSPGRFESPILKIANAYFPKAGMRVAVTLNPIDTNNLTMPPDLADKRFTDQEVIDRYKAAVDYVAGQLLDSDIHYFAVGNEVDGYLKSEQDWEEYSKFFEAVAPHIRSRFPGVKVGVKLMSPAIMEMTRGARRINQSTDVVLVTYYPFKPGGFQVRDPKTIHADLDLIAGNFGSKPVYFAEIGYPSSGLNGSSPEKQAEFIHETFLAWDKHREQVPFMYFQWLHDQAPGTVSGWLDYYGINDKSFESFLSSLGLRTYDGQDKPAFLQFKAELAARQW